MNKKFLCCMVALAGTLLITATEGFSFESLGNEVNSACAPERPFTGDCLLCHTSGSKGQGTPAQDAFNAGGSTLTSFFCPPSVPTCTDNDNDTFALEGGDCGPVDCNDSNAAINPAATENCTDSVDNNCNGLVDVQDPAGVGCADPDNTDNDGDGFTPAAGDCDDTDGDIYPDAVEICTDGIDNDCNGLIDTQDPNALDCTVACIDNDGDTYASNGGECGPVDCHDNDTDVNPGTEEVCDDGRDNDCDGMIDEGCDATCPDADGDGFMDVACGGADCNDNDVAMNPGIAEICGNGVDENCNGASDDACLTCPDGSLLVIKEIDYDRDDQELQVKGRATVGTTVSIINADTSETLAGEIRVRRGKWKTKIKNIDSFLMNITAITSNGCAVDQAIETDDNDSDDDDDHDHDDNNDGRDDDHDDRRSRR